jgi:hypothetical protein
MATVGEETEGRFSPAGRLDELSEMTIALPWGICPMRTGKRTGLLSEIMPK